MDKKYFLRISRYSDKNWKSYRLPEDHDWFSEQFESLDDMIEAGARQTEGLAGIEWQKPFFDMGDVVFAKDYVGFAIQPDEDVTVQDLILEGFIIRLYVGEKIEDIQDGVIFKPTPLTGEEAEEIMKQYEYLEIYPENYERGLLQADGDRCLYKANEIWDY